MISVTDKMQAFINTPFQIGSLILPNRLVQGPLAGFSCAPFRVMFHKFQQPAYCVTEMVSAKDVVHKHTNSSRYLYRAPEESCLSWQISGTDPEIMAQAAYALEKHGANLIDINCGCPKPKIRRKGAGSALLENSDKLMVIIQKIREKISIPLTVKIRIQENEEDCILANKIANAGANALIVHGRRWTDDYNKACNYQQIALIKKSVDIPVIANGDIEDRASLRKIWEETGCDAFMICRAGTGRPWIYQELLTGKNMEITLQERESLLKEHLQGLTRLEGEHKAMLQSFKLSKYYMNKC